MKFGLRIPSISKQFAARTSWKRVVRHSMGFKAARGWGWVTNPKKAAYNRIYNRTTFGIGDLLKNSRHTGKSSAGCLVVLIVIATVLTLLR